MKSRIGRDGQEHRRCRHGDSGDERRQSRFRQARQPRLERDRSTRHQQGIGGRDVIGPAAPDHRGGDQEKPAHGDPAPPRESRPEGEGHKPSDPDRGRCAADDQDLLHQELAGRIGDVPFRREHSGVGDEGPAIRRLPDEVRSGDGKGDEAADPGRPSREQPPLGRREQPRRD